MTTSEPWTAIPDGWPAVPPEVVEQAKRQAHIALASDGERRAADRLARFYDTESNYAGASFADLEPNHWTEVTATDLHATSLLSINVGPQATRRLLGPGTHRRAVLRELRTLPDRDLAEADALTLAAMDRFYRAVKATISSTAARDPNPWVTASKLCARKRPDLFPVRDRNVCTHLGILKLNDVRADWQVFRAVIQDSEMRQVLDSLPSQTRNVAEGRRLALDHSHLRLLDAAIWTYTVWYADES